MATTRARLLTAEDLERMTDLPDGRYDLLDGELIRMAPASEEHGTDALNILVPLHLHVQDRGLGLVYPPETGFVVDPASDQVVSPDVAFVRAERLDPLRDRRRFLRIPPDFAVEVVSPTDYPALVERKIAKYLAAGVPLLWVVYPATRRVRVVGAGRAEQEFGDDDVLDASDVVPGFRLAVADIFA